MPVLFWITLNIIIIATFILLVSLLWNRISFVNIFETITNGFQDALKTCGFKIRSRQYPVELYVWVLPEDSDCCEDCMERSTWPPMDIADWMRLGLPNTPEAQLRCSEPHHAEECHCQLILFPSNKRTHPNKPF